jgi:hypothetical protein
MKKVLLSLMVCGLFGINFPQKCSADVYASQTFTLTIPETASVSFTSDSTNFGAIETREYGISNKAAHVITVGDGTSNYTHITSNDPEKIGNKEFNLTFTGNGNNVNVQTVESGAKVVVQGTQNTSVEILLTDKTQSSAPRLGNGEGVPFTVKDSSSLAIPPSSNVPFSENSAGLNLKMDLDESSLDINDKPQMLSFNVVLSVIGVD